MIGPLLPGVRQRPRIAVASDSMASDGFTAVVRAHRDGDAAALVRAVQELALSTDLGSVPADRAAEVGNAFYRMRF